jgi:hypothetical protein
VTQIQLFGRRQQWHPTSSQQPGPQVLRSSGPQVLTHRPGQARDKGPTSRSDRPSMAAQPRWGRGGRSGDRPPAPNPTQPCGGRSPRPWPRRSSTKCRADPPQVHVQGEQHLIGTAVAAPREQIDVMNPGGCQILGSGEARWGSNSHGGASAASQAPARPAQAGSAHQRREGRTGPAAQGKPGAQEGKSFSGWRQRTMASGHSATPRGCKEQLPPRGFG